MPKAVEVFTPNDLPTFSYVERKRHNFEERLREALSIPKMIVSLSGPSKSGKTVLVNKVVEADNLIPLSGATIRSADALWSKVLDWWKGHMKELRHNRLSCPAKQAGRPEGG